jgi:hypothetical protein
MREQASLFDLAEDPDIHAESEDVGAFSGADHPCELQERGGECAICEARRARNPALDTEERSEDGGRRFYCLPGETTPLGWRPDEWQEYRRVREARAAAPGGGYNLGHWCYVALGGSLPPVDQLAYGTPAVGPAPA